jgi:ABC-type nitrate/sulfonate/bicarbonate transport system substrate-binding protein
MMRLQSRALAALAAFLLLAVGIARADEPVKIRAGWLVVPNMIFPLMPLKPDVLRHYGKSYVLDLIHFTGTPPQITALAANEIDLSPLSFSAFGLAVTNAKLSDLRILADGLQDGEAGWQTNAFLVLKDGPIQKVEDLKGQVLASNAFGGAVDVGLRVMLRKHGLEDKRDVTIIEVQVPNMKATLAERKAALIAPLPPFTRDPELRQISRTLFTQRDALGSHRRSSSRRGAVSSRRTAPRPSIFSRISSFFCAGSPIPPTTRTRWRSPRALTNRHPIGSIGPSRMMIPTAIRRACRRLPRSNRTSTRCAISALSKRRSRLGNTSI